MMEICVENSESALSDGVRVFFENLRSSLSRSRRSMHCMSFVPKQRIFLSGLYRVLGDMRYFLENKTTKHLIQFKRVEK